MPQFTPNIKRNCRLKLSYAKDSSDGRRLPANGGRNDARPEAADEIVVRDGHLTINLSKLSDGWRARIESAYEGRVFDGRVTEMSDLLAGRAVPSAVKSIVLASRCAIPEMRKSGGGAIINVSSIAGLRANSSAPYTTSKAAVIGLTKSMAGDHGRDGIRVNCIAPGLVYTPMVAPRMDDDLRRVRMEAAPLGTEGTAWDVAWAAVYLASDEARWVTGVTLPVNAGLLTTTPVTYNRLAQQRHDGPVGG